MCSARYPKIVSERPIRCVAAVTKCLYDYLSVVSLEMSFVTPFWSVVVGWPRLKKGYGRTARLIGLACTEISIGVFHRPVCGTVETTIGASTPVGIGWCRRLTVAGSCAFVGAGCGAAAVVGGVVCFACAAFG